MDYHSYALRISKDIRSGQTSEAPGSTAPCPRRTQRQHRAWPPQGTSMKVILVSEMCFFWGTNGDNMGKYWEDANIMGL